MCCIDELNPQSKPVPPDMERFRIEVGHDHEVKPGNIVGAFANEAGIDAEHIGHVDIQSDHSLVDLPLGMPRDIFRDLKKAWVCGQKLNISRLNPTKSDRKPQRKKKPAQGKKKAERAKKTTRKKRVKTEE